MDIDIGREVTVRRWRVEHAQYGGEDVLMNTVDFALEYKNASGWWVEAKRIQHNTAAVTDVLLDEPVTAQEWRLRIYDDGTSPGAVSAFMNGRCSRPPSSPDGAGVHPVCRRREWHGCQ